MGEAAPTLPGMPPALPDRVEALCAALADRIEARDGHRPRVTQNWRRDMRLLCERGPLGAEPHPVSPDVVDSVIRWTFDGDTWWAERLTAPAMLRKHWGRIHREARQAAKRRPQAATADLIGRLRRL